MPYLLQRKACFRCVIYLQYLQYLHTESNGDYEVRSPMLYPLSYAGIAGAAGIEPASPESESGTLTIMLSASVMTGIRTRIRRFVAVRSIRWPITTKSSQSDSNAHLLGCNQPPSPFGYGNIRRHCQDRTDIPGVKVRYTHHCAKRR